MRRCAAFFTVVLAVPVSAAAQTPAEPVNAGAEAQSSTPPPDESSAALARIKRRLLTDTPLRDTAAQMPVTPTFRTSVTERIDIWKFWGEPDEVAAYVRPRGGTWHTGR